MKPDPSGSRALLCYHLSCCSSSWLHLVSRDVLVPSTVALAEETRADAPVASGRTENVSARKFCVNTHGSSVCFLSGARLGSGARLRTIFSRTFCGSTEWFYGSSSSSGRI
ncbi:unnamed protein product [Lota lota]